MISGSMWQRSGERLDTAVSLSWPVVPRGVFLGLLPDGS